MVVLWAKILLLCVFASWYLVFVLQDHCLLPIVLLPVPVTSRLDYCNTLITCIPTKFLGRPISHFENLCFSLFDVVVVCCPVWHHVVSKKDLRILAILPPQCSMNSTNYGSVHMLSVL